MAYDNKTMEKSDLMYRLLVQGVVDYAIYMLAPDGTVANWNAGAQRAKGYTEDEIVGSHFSCFYSPEDQARGVPEAGLRTARESGRFEAEGRRFRKDGSWFWAHVVIDAIRDEQGGLIGFAKVTRDVTKKREQEQELLVAKELAERYSEEMAQLSGFLDTVIANIPSSVLVLDAVSREILLVNRQAEQLYGNNRTRMIGRTVQQCLAPELAAWLERLADTSMRQDDLCRSEDTVATPGGTRTLRARALSIRGTGPGRSYLLSIADDVTEETAANAQIHHMALHDTLTGLPNRILFRQRLNEALGAAWPRERQTAALYLDLDNFKNVNDALGHHVGDELLRAIGKRLRAVLRDQDTLARLGGDEFAVVLPGLHKIEDAQQTAQRLIDAVRPEFSIDGHLMQSGVSVGIAFAAEGVHSADQILRYADMALYEAKRNGRNRCEVFQPEMDAAARKRRVVEMDLREAIASGQLELYYQPIADQRSAAVVGYEALMRWKHPTAGLIMPLEFIPIAEETGLIHDIGALALHDACIEAAGWEGGQSVAVNLSPVQFKNQNLLASVESALRMSGLAPQRLELEITESVLLDSSNSNIDTLRRIKALGVRIALDDFGTGYSSLSYLRSFPFDRVKIDRSFIQDMATSREALAIVRAITGIGRSLEIETTAEGIETEEQFLRLQEEGCSHFQGYLFGRPQPAAARLTLFAPVGAATPADWGLAPSDPLR